MGLWGGGREGRERGFNVKRKQQQGCRVPSSNMCRVSFFSPLMSSFITVSFSSYQNMINFRHHPLWTPPPSPRLVVILKEDGNPADFRG
jgi:hypothetical protein